MRSGRRGYCEGDPREEGCADGIGTQVRAFTLVPLSSLSESLESASARVTAHWSVTGLESYDRAMGTDVWRVAAPRMVSAPQAFELPARASVLSGCAT